MFLCILHLILWIWPEEINTDSKTGTIQMSCLYKLIMYRYQEEQFLSYNYSPHFVGKYNIGWLFEEAYLF